MASTYIYKDMTGNTPSTKMTYSGWIKKVNPDDNGRIFGAQSIACHAYFGGSDGVLNIDFAARDSSSIIGIRKPTRLFRDTNAYYHIVFALDTTQGTADDRIKVWINGVQETSFTTKTNPSQNATTAYGDDGYYSVGARMSQQGGAGHYFDGLMSHVHYCDGYAYSASDFGETDATTGEWKIKTSPSVTHGTNGFFLKMENSANMDLDSSTNNHSFTTAGTLTKTEDCPSNVFATMNPLYNFYRDPTLSVGNTKIVDTNGWSGAKATLGFSTGKWYWEIKLTGTMENHQHGVQQENVDTISQDPQQRTGTTVFYNHDGGEMRVDGTTTAADYGLYSSGDIMGVAVDMTAGSYGQITYYKNGVALISNYNLSSSSTLVMPFSSVGACTSEYNFGNGYFGTTAVSSAGTNASGNGIFEYDVPANHTALSTKGLNL